MTKNDSIAIDRDLKKLSRNLDAFKLGCWASNDHFNLAKFISISSLLAFIFFAPFLNTAGAEGDEDAAPKAKVFVSRILAPTPEGMTRKQMRGKVGAKNLSGLAIVYSEDLNAKVSKEIWMPYESETYLDQYNDVESIQEGDEVKITFDEDKEGKGVKKMRGITLIRKAPVEQEVYDPDAVADAEAAS